jgi:hypothetical protein
MSSGEDSAEQQRQTGYDDIRNPQKGILSPDDSRRR